MKYGVITLRWWLGATALLAAVAANAATISPGDSVSLSIGDIYTADETVGVGAGSDTYTFTATEDLTSVSVVLGKPFVDPKVADLTLEWSIGGTVVSSKTFTDSVGAWLVPLPKLYQGMASGEVWTLAVSGTGLTDSAGYSLEVSAVPLPPAAIVFGSVLAGAGFFSRRKKKSASLQAMPA